MGHKVHPKIHRLPVLFPWTSRWVAKSNYADSLREDLQIRQYLQKKCKEAQIDSIHIERSAKQMTITIFAGKPGVMIGRGGQGLDQLRKDIERQFLHMSRKVKLNIQEVSAPSLSAQIVADGVAKDIEGRLPFRRIIKQNMERVMKAGGQGVKIALAGRLNGVEIARREKMAVGKIPLITFRSNVDYAAVTAKTLQGSIGVKVWIYKGESFGRVDRLADTNQVTQQKKNA